MLLAVLLTLHSWTRWAIVIGTLAIGARSAKGWLGKEATWGTREDSFARAWVGVVDFQIVLGFLLYFVASPMAAIARQDLGAAWGEPTTRFFGILHPLAMLLVGFATHAAWVTARRSDDPRVRYRRVAVGATVMLLLLTIAVPWPFFPWGRPLARL